jgi:hypothetical protein
MSRDAELEQAIGAGRSALARSWEGDDLCRIPAPALRLLVSAATVVAIAAASAPREMQATDPREPGGET